MMRFLTDGDWYRAVWRWHFYAGLFCLPFVIWLAATGAIYLFKPQIESLIDRPTRGLAFEAAPAAPSEIAAAAIAAVPGSVLHRYVLPDDTRDAVQVIVGAGARETRVFVHPASREILKAVDEEERFMRKIFLLHGELYAGRWGSTLVEIAASWTIVMLLTGLFLWWPRRGAKFAGTVYPRLSAGGRVFWRDLHAVIGLWVSFAAIFLIFSGLPWAQNWGRYLNLVREVTNTAGVRDWSTGSDEEAVRRAATDANLRAMLDPPAGHHGMGMSHI
ncbi:MAG: PepSY domain-containing protein, partial [Proteobacteria bacterium]|nr:PepSY domain-containing protein [Pseudomonadota bacterium]